MMTELRQHIIRIYGFVFIIMSLWHWPEAQEAKTGEPFFSAKELSEPLSAVTEPGLLSRVHKQLEGIENCEACHPTSKSPGKTKCLNCHTEIKERWDKNAGYHGKYLKGNCISCHTEHKGLDANIIDFNQVLFNHNLALFPLEGKHKDVACEKCHLVKSGETGVLGLRYIGLSTECYQCHSSPHSNISIDCTNCHTQLGWTGKQLLFNHNRDSAFPLRGAHIDLACKDCHPQKAYKPKPVNCSGCHIDPHQGELGSNCTRCHNELNWKDARFIFDHDTMTSFTLVGKHRDLDCSQCHSKQYAGTPQECSACHSVPHKDDFGETCVSCHGQISWKVINIKAFNHNSLTDFKLTGKHVNLACEKCHTADSLLIVKGKTCVECHPDIYHRNELGAKCERCHDTTGWKIRPVDFDHKSLAKYDLGKLHADLDCSACHTTKDIFTGLKTTCESCHVQPSDFIKGVSIFDDITTMPSSMHIKVTCTDCHSIQDTPGSIGRIAQRCTTCHHSSYENLCLYWKSDFDYRAKRLAARVDSLRAFLERRNQSFDSLSSSAELSLQTFASKINHVKQVVSRLQTLGIHNMILAQKEYEYSRRILDDLFELLQIELNYGRTQSEQEE